MPKTLKQCTLLDRFLFDQTMDCPEAHEAALQIILNDPGTSNGGGAMVPLEAFVDAWEDSGCFMVAAYA